MHSVEEIRSLDESFEGLAETLNGLIELLPGGKGFFSVDKRDGSEVSRLVASHTALPGKEQVFTIDIEREAWCALNEPVWSRFWPIADSLSLPVWILSKVAEGFESNIETVWTWFENSGDSLGAQAVVAIHQPLCLVLKLLCAIKSGELGSHADSFASEMRSASNYLLPLHAEKFWEFQEKGLAGLLEEFAESKWSTNNNKFICDLLDENGYPPGYKHGLAQEIDRAVESDIDRLFRHFKR